MVDVQQINQLSTGYPQAFLDSERVGKSPLDSTYKIFSPDKKIGLLCTELVDSLSLFLTNSYIVQTPLLW